MKSTISIPLLALLLLPAGSPAQEVPRAIPDAPTPQAKVVRIDAIPGDENTDSGDAQPKTIDSSSARPSPAIHSTSGLTDKFHYYVSETYLNVSALTAPAFRAGIRMANPPGKGATAYPSEWRQGAEAFGRNYGDAVAQRVSFQTARFVTGTITREDPRYSPSSSRNFLARSLHAFTFTFVDRSDSGHPMPALSNFVGAAASGFVGNAYLPAGFNSLTHAGQRATLQFGVAAGGNLFREFAPQMPGPIRAFIMLIAR
jgi:hypothetical protein